MMAKPTITAVVTCARKLQAILSLWFLGREISGHESLAKLPKEFIIASTDRKIQMFTFNHRFTLKLNLLMVSKVVGTLQKRFPKGKWVQIGNNF